MEKLLEQKYVTSSLLKTNLKIHGNLWKFYGISLLLSGIFILIKGF